MNSIPFDKTITYNDIAKTIAKKRTINKISAQAVGGAVVKNPIPVLKFLNILFHVTLTPYKQDIEPNVINKTKIITSIKELSKIIE